MIGPVYRSAAVQALLGPAHSPVIPTALWTGWLDGAGALIAMTGLSVEHDVWGPAGDGVTNTQPLDCGVAGTGWEIHALGLFDAEAGALVVSADLAVPLTPADGDPLVFAAGGLTFQVSA